MKSQLPHILLKTNSGLLYKNLLETYNNYISPSHLATHICKLLKDKTSDISKSGIKDKGQQSKSITGRVFELLIAEILKINEITPFYMQAKIWNMPSEKIDFVCYSPTTPVIISTKFSIAERWRATAIEGILLQNIYSNAKCYLLSDHEEQVKKRNDAITRKDIRGIDKCIFVRSEAMDRFIDNLKRNYKFEKAQPITPITCAKNKLIE